MSSPTPLLFTPLKIGRVTAKNRIAISPMCQFSATDGFFTDWHLVHLGSRAVGGAGIVMTEATGVLPEGRISPKCTGIWKDEHIPQLKRITEFIKSQNSIPGIQLAHAGRKSSTRVPWERGMDSTISIEEGGWQTIAPSAIAFNPEKDPVPKEATLEDIDRIKKAFVSAALRALKAGFEIIELHYSNGYLVNSFLSPYSNKRTDKYGGSFEGRTRLALEIIHDVKQVLPEDFPLLVRISADDYAPEGEGWELKDSVELAKLFKKAGVHLVDCIAGGIVHNLKFFEMMKEQYKMAARIQKEADIPTGACGGIVNPDWAESILQHNQASLILVARATLADSEWAWNAALHLGVDSHQVPQQYSYVVGAQTFGNWRQTLLADQNSEQLAEAN